MSEICNEDNLDSRIIEFCTKFVNHFFLTLKTKVENVEGDAKFFEEGKFSKGGEYLGMGVGSILTLALFTPGMIKIGKGVGKVGGSVTMDSFPTISVFPIRLLATTS